MQLTNTAWPCLLLAVAVSGMAITGSEQGATRHDTEATRTEDNGINNAVRTFLERGSRNKEKEISLQLKQLKKLCRPRLKAVWVKDELSPSSELLDYHLLPEVLAVKRCNNCTYCGNGFDQPGLQTKTCTATKHKEKIFTIRVINGTQNIYEELPIRVDHKCRCRRSRVRPPTC